MQWVKRPIIYEIHTWVWLADLSVRYNRPITLGNVPPAEWDALAALTVDAIWLMGVWQRSPAGIVISNANAGLQMEFQQALSDYTPTDNVGSAYAVRDYVVEERLGGAQGLAQARQELAQRQLQLVLDLVPNHIAVDHPWVTAHPEYLIRGTAQDLQDLPIEFIEIDGRVFANGRDPHFPPWRDVVQVNAFSPAFRTASIATVKNIAAQCDGLRCDMAILMLNAVFARTWGARAGAIPGVEYWRELIPAVKAEFPGLLFIAEAYWDLEYELMQNGFDYCYDKRLYDRLVRNDAETIRTHLFASIEYQDKLVRFIENHDEARAAAVFDPRQERAAATMVATVPGAKLLYEGQFEGRKIKTPVFMARRQAEAADFEMASFYRLLLKTIDTPLFHRGTWTLCECMGWSDNPSYRNVLAWTWHLDRERVLVVANYSAQRSQAMVQLPWADLGGQVWRLADALNGDVFHRDGSQLGETGLYVDLDGWRVHFLTFE